MKQYTRFYIDKDENIRHVHTNSEPFYFEPIVDKDVSRKIDVEIDIDDKQFVSAKEIRDDACIDKNDSLVFHSNKRLRAATKRRVRSERVNPHEDTY